MLMQEIKQQWPEKISNEGFISYFSSFIFNLNRKLGEAEMTKNIVGSNS